MVSGNKAEVRDFLISRRARLTPETVGLSDFGGSRRVPGLRRSEVVQLAGMSLEYYTQLERGGIGGASEGVLDAVARALRLDEAERAHLLDLARVAAAGRTPRTRPQTSHVRAGIQRIIDAQLSPAWVVNGRGDLLATNVLGRALNAPLFEDPARPVNLARFRFLDRRAPEFYLDWEQTGADAVAALRSEAGRNPFDKALTDLVGELSTRSEEFRARGAAHDVRMHRSGVKRIHHPVVGDLELSYEGLVLPADPGLVLFVYTAEPGSPSQEALHLLASWAAAPAEVARPTP